MTDLIKNSALITYSPTQFSQCPCDELASLDFSIESNQIYWLNTYGLHDVDSMNAIVRANGFDDFLQTLLHDPIHANKVLELEALIFIALKVMNTDSEELDNEQMIFIVTENMLWSLQENFGSYFEWIRARLRQGKGQARKRSVDYLLFLLIDSLVDNYEAAFSKLTDNAISDLHVTEITPTPEFTARVEAQKRRLLNFKKATLSLRNTILKIEKVTSIPLETMYFTELKEQTNNLLDATDFELFELDSKINLIFSIQSHRLNEIMRILTVISVVFIPLTFLAGIYGMNFEYMPELKAENGYFIFLGVIFVIGICIVAYFRHKKWF